MLRTSTCIDAVFLPVQYLVCVLILILISAGHEAVLAQTWSPLDLSPESTAIVTYPITGHIGIGGITVNLTGSSVSQTKTNAAGDFGFNVEAGGTYSVTPVGSGTLQFMPASRTFSDLSGPETANFTAVIVDFWPVNNFDFDGDGKADFAVFRPSDNMWYLQRSYYGFYAVQFGLPGDKLVPADYTGDLKTDIAVWRPSDGTWYVLRGDDNTFFGRQFGANGDEPSPADFDGDGIADLAVFRSSSGTCSFSGLRLGLLFSSSALAAIIPRSETTTAMEG